MPGKFNMADKPENINPPQRLILAPHIWPLLPEKSGAHKAEPFYYLSWAGWELYLTRRLALARDCQGPVPLLLPDVHDPETDFAAIDQLVKAAGDMGAGLLGLPGGGVAESVFSLAGAIRGYGATSSRSGPVLDDRSYLALWTAVEYDSLRSNQLLAQAAQSRKDMMAALKGLEDDDEEVMPDSSSYEDEIRPASSDSERRADYAGECWRRLAEPLLIPSDIIITTLNVTC